MLGRSVPTLVLLAIAATPAPVSATDVGAVTIVPPLFVSIAIAPGGTTTIAGTAEPGATVDIVDGPHILSSVTADATGRFSLEARGLAPGPHSLGLRATSADGSAEVVSDDRVALTVPSSDGAQATVAVARPGLPEQTVAATPPAPAPAVTTAPTPADRTVTVQPGDTLWTIALAALGDGDAWTSIYDANRGQISNPRWIYPGQVLALPGTR